MCRADPTADDDAGPSVTQQCQACLCSSCFAQINDCRASAGCWDIVECARAVGCSGDACYTPTTCQAVIDGTPGGATSPGSMSAGTFGTCAMTKCTDECG